MTKPQYPLQPLPQPINQLPTWLHMLAAVYPPQQVALVGAGNGTGVLVQWLRSLASTAEQAGPAVTLLEPHAPSMAQLTKWLAVQGTSGQANPNKCAHWQLRPDAVAPTEGDHTYYRYSLATENSLLPPEALHSLWPSLQLQAQQHTPCVALASVLPANWLLLDCLPAAQLLQDTPLLASTQVVLARVVLSDNAVPGTSVAEVDNLLAQSGFKAVATFAERNNALGKALWVRDFIGLQAEKAQLAEAKDKAIGQAQQLEQDLAQALRRMDELAKGKAAETAAKQAEAQARSTEQSAKAEALVQVEALRSEKAQLAESKDKAIGQLQQLEQDLAQALLRMDELAKGKAAETAAKQAEAQARSAEQSATAEALAQVQALQSEKAQLAEAKDKAIGQVQQLEQDLAQALLRMDELAKGKAAETAAKQAEAQARSAEQSANAAALAQVQALQSEKVFHFETFQKDIEGLKKLKEEWVDANKNPYAHNRTLTATLNAGLRDFANKSLGLQYVNPAYLDYLAVKAQQVEKNSVGRLATTVQDAVARQLVIECLGEERAHILEIGALYGVSMAILYNHAITRVQDVSMICLDPFDGYYGRAVDSLLNQPVNELTFQRNMTLANVPKCHYSIVKRYSTDPLAREEIKDKSFNLLIIDGDHSYEGVKFDFENFFPLLEKGGYVVFDDYNAKEWPGVQQFIDEDLKAHANLQYLGAFSRTAVGRKLY